MSEPAYTRLDVEERRRRLLELGTTLFARHDYDELSMAAIAREAGISKALLYHYFPSKQAYFVATLEEKAAELAGRIAPDPSLAPAEQLAASLGVFLRWVEENGDGYAKLVRGAGAVPEVREVMEEVRAATAELILAGLPGPPSPVRRTAVRVAVVHGRRDPRLARAPRPRARRSPRAAAAGARGRSRRAVLALGRLRRPRVRRRCGAARDRDPRARAL